MIGGVVSTATARWQLAHQQAVADLQEARKQEEADAADRRKTEAEVAERQRREFQVRAELLDRSSRWAQRMYVTCQHVWRIKRDAAASSASARDSRDPGRLSDAMDLLHRTYLEFSAEAAALQTEFGARFAIVTGYSPEFELGPAAGGSAVVGDQRTLDESPSGQGDERYPYLRWHQANDLLTVYYFTLCENFRHNILRTNSMGHESKFHSGVRFTELVPRPAGTGSTDIVPTAAEASAVIQSIRQQFLLTMPALARATLDGELREL